MSVQSCGILFDMDELLVNSRAIWRAAETELLAAMGHDYDPRIAQQYKGLNGRDLAAMAARLLGAAGPVEHYQQVMRQALVRHWSSDEIIPMPGAVELVRRLADLAPMAVASGSPLEGIQRALERLGIASCMSAVISSESVPRGKPHPDVFLAAAEAIGAQPARCLVFEDAIFGVQAALACGMRVFVVPSTNNPDLPRLATRMYRSLADVTRADAAAALAGEA